MSIDKCIIDAKKNSGLDAESADIIEKQVSKFSKVPMSEKTNSINEYKKARRKINMEARARQLRKIAAIRGRVETASVVSNKVEGVLAGLVGTKYSNKLRGHLSAHTVIQGLIGKYETTFHKAMRDSGLDKLIENREAIKAISPDIYKEQFGIDSGNPNAKIISDTMRTIDNLKVADKVEAGVITRGLKNRIVKTINDPIKMTEVGFETWKQDRINATGMDRIKEIFSDLEDKNGVFDVAKLDEAMKKIYDKITASESGYVPLDMSVGLGRKSPFGKHRVFDFKDWNSAHEYNTKYGSGETVVEQFYNGLQADAISIAEAGFFGDAANFSKVLNVVERTITDPKQKKKFRSNKRFLNDLYNEVFGRNTATSTAAKFFRQQRQLSSLVNLGGVALTALPTDIVNGIASIASENGGNIFQASRKFISAMTANLDKKTRIKTLESMDFVLQGSLATLAERLSDDNNYQSGKLHNLSQRFFKLNGLNWVTNLTRSAATRVFLSDFGDIVNRASSLEKITDEGALKNFNNVGFNEANFADVKKAMTNLEGFPNTPVVTMESLRDTGASLDTQRKYSALSRHKVNNSVVEAGPLQRVQMRFGSDPNSVGGAALESFLQYKSFALSDFRAKETNLFNLDKVGESGVLDVIKRNPSFMAKITMMAALAGYVSMSSKSVIRGQEPPDPLDINTAKNALMLGGAFGLYGDLLLPEYEKSYVNAQSTLLGPLGDVSSDFTKLLGNISTGNIDKSPRDIFRLIENFNPNLPILSTATDYLIMRDLKELVSPGSARRKERNFEHQEGVFSEKRNYLVPAAKPTSSLFGL